VNGPNLRIPLLQRERSYTGILTGLIAVLAVMLFGASTRKFYAYTMDDAFITFRYAQNFVSGHGLFFNPDDPTRAEGITSPLYALILAPFLLLGGAIVEPSKWFGVAVTVATAAVTALTTRRLTSSLDQRDSVVIAVLCAAYFLADPFAAAHAVTGMETALSCLAYSAFLLLLVPLEPADAARRRGKAIAAGFAAVSVPMLRPEMALAVSAMLVLFAMLHRESRRETLLAGAVFVTFGAIYFAIRFAYYGLLLPLPFYVKQAVGLRGTIDVARYVRHALPLFAALLLFIASLLRSEPWPARLSRSVNPLPRVRLGRLPLRGRGPRAQPMLLRRSH